MTLSDPIFTTLDPDQRKAVLHDGGPLLLVAGAGSGKTRAIVARILRLIHDGVPARSILGITFTNRAAGEMRERVVKALSGGGTASVGDLLAGAFPAPDPRRSNLPWLGTFHAFGAALLRRHGDRIGLSPRFVIYDVRDQHDALKAILKDLNIDEKKFPPSKFAWLIERSKRDGVSVEAAALAAGWRFVSMAEQVGKAYDAALKEAGAADFADLIRLPVTLLQGAPDILDSVRAEYRHFLVDEFQDVDAAQAELTELIALGADSFCAVGDEDQSIYGWRGASAGPMLSFERRYPGARVIHLSTNYRSRASILSVAGALIAKNRMRREKAIVPSREGGEPPVDGGLPRPGGGGAGGRGGGFPRDRRRGAAHGDRGLLPRERPVPGGRGRAPHAPDPVRPAGGALLLRTGGGPGRGVVPEVVPQPRGRGVAQAAPQVPPAGRRRRDAFQGEGSGEAGGRPPVRKRCGASRTWRRCSTSATCGFPSSRRCPRRKRCTPS